MAPTAPRYYFAYGSSLSQADMQSRCPNSNFYSIAILRNHRWIINERGYANVLPASPGPSRAEELVWGIVYSLRPFEEEMLDKSEGLPWAYSKEDMDVEAVSISDDGRSTRREVVRALVYIDRERVQESYPFPEFVLKMSEGIEEGMKRGIPRTWIDSVIRGYLVIPEESANTEMSGEGILAKGKPNPASSVSSGGKQLSRDQQEPRQINQIDSLVNGSAQRKTSQNKQKSFGLEHSIYAHNNSANGSLPPPSPKVKRATPGAKQVCWWWKVKGACRFSDKTCQFAHYDTGIPPEPPGSRQAKGFANNKDMNTPKKDWKSNSSHNKGQHHQANNHHHRAVEQSFDQGEQSWGANEGATADEQSWAPAPPTLVPDTRPWGEEEAPMAVKVPSWNAASETAAKAGSSWADDTPATQESARGNGPDWLSSSDTQGVKW